MTYTQPLLLVFFALSFAGLWRSWRDFGQRKPWLLIAGLAGLFLSCWPPADWMLSRLVEWPYADAGEPAGDAQAIVVLSSDVRPAGRHSPLPTPDPTSSGACRYAAWLYRNWRPLPVIVSGGKRRDAAAPMSAALAHLVEAEGVPAAKIFQEDRSANTHENARFSAELLRRMGIGKVALVVEADSMLRAEWCFRREGIEVVPAPFGHRKFEMNAGELMPSWSALRKNERVVHELAGIVWYKLRGWI